MPAPLLTRRTALLAEIEDTFNVAQATDPATDAILIGDPGYNLDITNLERNFSRDSLSKLAGITGRKLASMTFSTEIRGNGLVQSGNAADAPRMTKLFRACGYNLTALSTNSAGTVHNVGEHPILVDWTPSGTFTNTEVIPYVLTCVAGGASGVATVKVDSPVTGESSSAATVTDSSAFTVGTKGLELTPDFSGSLTAGQTWFVLLKPTGVELEPVSTGFESVTLRMYLDGILHTMTGCMGTFVINAQAGQLPNIQWTFTGQYVTPVDAAMPAAIYETTKPSQFELAQITVDGFGAIIDNVSFTQGNEINVRPDANSSDGYNGTSITARNPSMGIDPEATLVADHDFWGKMGAARRMPVTCRFGSITGSRVYMNVPSARYTGMTYADRNNSRVLDAALEISGAAGDDDVSFIFA